jgi:hypothetical protein
MNSAQRSVRTAIAFLTGGAIVAALAAPALASHVLTRTTVPDEAIVGQTVQIPVVLESLDGAPLQGTTVVFYLHVSFAGVEGEAEIGRAVTDEHGVAALAYRPRMAGHHQLRMEYASPEGGELEVISTVFDVSGGEQLVRSHEGVAIPGVGGGLLMAVLATVWSILLWVAFRLVAIARAGGEPGVPGIDQTP